MTAALEMMSKMFADIKKKKDDIEEIEQLIRIDFEKNVIKFFKQKGFSFEAVDNKYDPINRYRLPNSKHENNNFKDISTINYYIIPEIEGNIINFVPQFNIVPWEFTIKFVWWKSNNGSATKVYWHPEEISLEEFYNKKLKKVFNLI